VKEERMSSTAGENIRPGIRRLFHLALHRGENARAEVDEEIRLHLALRTAQLTREGLSPEAARAEAERRFGPPDEARGRLHTSAQRREERMLHRELLDAARSDLRVALRGLRRAPGLVVTAVLSLALGIGANAAIFSLFDQLLVRPLPVPHPEQLVKLVAPGPRSGGSACGEVGECNETFSYPMFRDLERGKTGLIVAGHTLVSASVTYGDRTVPGRGALVSGGYFRALGLQPALGRLLQPSDDETLGGHPVTVLDYSYWQSQLGGDPMVLNRTIVVDGQPVTVVGVAPRGFDGTTLGARPLVYLPLSMTPQIAHTMDGMVNFDTNRRFYWLFAFGRIAPGSDIERSQTAINTVYRPIITDVEAPLQEGLTDKEMAAFREAKLELKPAARGQSQLEGDVRTPLVLLFAVAGVVLLIACANIASLLLVRGASRGMEVAVRLSLGAGRRRVILQLLTEAMVLAVVGGIAGLLVAHGTLKLAASILPTSAASAVQFGLRWPVVFFAVALTIGTGFVFGLFPAFHSTRESLVTTIRANAGQIAGARSTLRSHATLVVGQIALSTVLLVAAGLFLKSLRNVAREDLGLAVDQLATFTVSPDLNGYSPERSRALFRRLDAELAAVPGVTSVSSARVPLFTGGGWSSGAQIEGVKYEPGMDNATLINLIGPGYFRTLGIPLLSGREFTTADRETTGRVGIVNAAFVKKFGLGREAIDRRVAIWGDKEPNIQIVGVVADSKYQAVKDRLRPIVYTAHLQDAKLGRVTYYVRTSGDPAPVLRQISAVMSRVDPDVPVQELKTLPQQIRENVAVDRMIGTLSAAFASLATLLAAVGLYGVLGYTVARRTREIGVRMALGADQWNVRRLVLRQVAWMTLAGGVVGIITALAFGRTARSLLFGLDEHDPATVVMAALVLAAVALAAAYLPARRASSIDPMSALRAD
jgi:predicted permease